MVPTCVVAGKQSKPIYRIHPRVCRVTQCFGKDNGATSGTLVCVECTTVWSVELSWTNIGGFMGPSKESSSTRCFGDRIELPDNASEPAVHTALLLQSVSASELAHQYTAYHTEVDGDIS